MKTLIQFFTLTLTLVFSFSAQAEVIEMDQFPGQLPAVESVLPLVTRGFTMNLLVLNNGGSTDIYSYLFPKSAVLTVYKSGEEWNNSASYTLFSFVKIIGTRFNVKNGTLVIDYTVRNEDNYKLEAKTATVDMSEVMKEVTKGVKIKAPVQLN